MSILFYEKLCASTQELQVELLHHPLIQKTELGDISVEEYAYFLAQAYHHVKHTVPMLMACGSRLKNHQRWLEKPIIEYINEEQGHDEWILNDLSNLGFNDQCQIKQNACPDIRSFVAYGFYAIEYINPVSVFGVVHMLEGTSVKIATPIADIIEKQLGSKANITSYLRAHGSLDVKHVEHFIQLMNKIEDSEDQKNIIESAKQSYRIYINMLTHVMKQANSLRDTKNEQSSVFTE